MNTRIAGYDFARSLALFGLVVATFNHHAYDSDFYLLDPFPKDGLPRPF